MSYVSGAHSVYSIHYHLVLVTKYRRPCLTPEITARIDEVTATVLRSNKGKVLEANGEADHRQFLLSCPPSVQPSRLVGTIKTSTSRIVREEFAHHLRRFYWKPVFWSRSYCLISAGGAPLDVIKRYIQNQGSGA